MRRQAHRRPLFDRKVKYESKDKWGKKQTREYVRQGVISSAYRRVADWFGSLFKTEKIATLDLRADRPRGAGAAMLRHWWPGLSKRMPPPQKLRHARDGKPV